MNSIKGSSIIDMNMNEFKFAQVCSDFKALNKYSENDEQPKKRNMESL